MVYLIAVLGIILIVLVKLYLHRKYLIVKTQRNTSRKTHNYIYFFRGRNENRWIIKIGRTNDIDHRMKAHRTANPYGVVVVCCFKTKNDVAAERFLHNIFRRERISKSGEWFRWTFDMALVMWLLNDVELTRKVNACTRLR